MQVPLQGRVHRVSPACRWQCSEAQSPFREELVQQMQTYQPSIFACAFPGTPVPVSLACRYLPESQLLTATRSAPCSQPIFLKPVHQRCRPGAKADQRSPPDCTSRKGALAKHCFNIQSPQVGEAVLGSAVCAKTSKAHPMWSSLFLPSSELSRFRWWARYVLVASHSQSDVMSC